MLCLLTTLALCGLPSEPNRDLPPNQIAWQRSLSDAQHVARAENRPLLVAINVDGESASDRIVTERYRDPQFVAWTRRFTCVIGHPLRHTERDHDDQGRRVVCPRLGSVTCGEHMALEPQLFEAYLGGERVSPRHALVMPDGTKSFDLYYLFDMGDLDAKLEPAAALAPPDTTDQIWFPVHGSPEALRDALVAGRASWQRDFVERIFFDLPHDGTDVPEQEVKRALGLDEGALVRSIARVGDAGSVEALRRVLQRARPPSQELVAQIEAAVVARGLEAPMRVALLEILQGAGRHPGEFGLGRDRQLVPLAGRCCAAVAAAGGTPDPAARTFLLSVLALGDPADRNAARAALSSMLPARGVEALDAVLFEEGGAIELADSLALGRELALAAKPSAPADGTSAPIDASVAAAAARTEDELVRDLEAAEQALGAGAADPQVMRRFGLANLRLAQARIANSGPDIGLLLQDAWSWMEKAAATMPADAELAIERARTAYLLSRFEDQARIADELLARATARPSPAAQSVLARYEAWGSGTTAGRKAVQRAAALAADDNALEGLRWLGDAHARLLGARAGGDAAVELRGLLRGGRALATACASRAAQDVDVQSLASFLQAAGHRRASLAVLQAGLLRFPESNLLRDLWRDALWAAGRSDLFPERSDWLAGVFPESGACAWYAGYAWLLRAERARRIEQPDEALRAYDEASSRFARSVELEPANADSAGHYSALAELGRGFTHYLVGRRIEASEALARALQMRPAIGDARDGLDREALDLVDGALEWTEAGASPVDTRAFADELARAVPGETRWILAVADAALREGLRADGRARRVAGADGPGPDAAGETGDLWLGQSIDVARSALVVADTAQTRAALAQSLTVQAERDLARGRTAPAEPALREAAQLLEDPVAEGESPADLARRLRARLGPARPVARPGR